MRTKNLPSLLSMLLLGALLATGCKGGEEREAQSTSQPTQIAQETTSQPNELRPEPQTVEIEEAAPPAAVPSAAELSLRERELAVREAEVAARERRLRQSPSPAPAPPRAPEPAPAPAAEEPEVTEPEPAEPTDLPETRAPEPEPEPQTVEVTVPAGTRFDVEVTSHLASNTSAPGQAFRVRVAEDVRSGGEVAIPAGSEILGEVVQAVPLRKVGGQAKLELRFTDLVLPSGATVPIDASFVQQGRNETGRDAATIGGGAAAGAILGRVAKKGDRSKGTLIGAILGAAAGAVIASRTPGEEVVIPEGTLLELKLDDSVTVQARR